MTGGAQGEAWEARELGPAGNAGGSCLHSSPDGEGQGQGQGEPA